MSNGNVARYKRIVQYFWDPEPKNYAGFGTPIWCLGERYGCEFEQGPIESNISGVEHRSQTLHDDTDSNLQTKSRTPDNSNEPTQGSVVAKRLKDHEDLEWPEDFLNDFESRIRFTYRANFPPIQDFLDSRSPNTSLSLRIRNHLVKAGGFTSDTGWGCMIRSGQCLLANALVMLHLGRGTNSRSQL